MLKTALLVLLFATPALADVLTNVEVIDGDTIRVDGETIRIIGLDTPESCDADGCPDTARPSCLAELLLGKKAKMLATDLIARGMELERMGKDRSGLALARIKVNGERYEDIMIDEGLAMPYDCPDGDCPAMTDWCGKR